MNVGDLYNLHPEVILIHGITRTGVESSVPPEKTLVERIKFAIESSKYKISTYSYVLNSMYCKEKCYSSIGLIIEEGKIIYASREDTGFSKFNLPQVAFDYEKVCWNDIFSVNKYNEIILRNVIIRGFVIHFIQEFCFEEIKLACKELNLPVYVNDGNGIFKVYILN